MSRSTNRAKSLAKSDLVLDAPLLFLNAIRNGLMEDEARGRSDALKLMKWAVERDIIEHDGPVTVADAIEWVSDVAVKMDDVDSPTGQVLTEIIRRRALEIAIDDGLLAADACGLCGETEVTVTARGLLVGAEICESARQRWPEQDDEEVLDALELAWGAMGSEGTRMGAMSVDMHSYAHYRDRAEKVGRPEEPRQDAVAHAVASAASLGARDPLRAGINVYYGVYSTEEALGAAQGYLDLITEGGIPVRREGDDAVLPKPADVYEAVDHLRQIGECIAEMDPEGPVLDRTIVADAVQWQVIAYARRQRLVYLRDGRAEFSRAAVAVASLICQMSATALEKTPDDDWPVPGVPREVVVADLTAGTQALWNLQAGLIANMIERPDGNDTEEDENVAAATAMLKEAAAEGTLADIAAEASAVMTGMAGDLRERGLID